MSFGRRNYYFEFEAVKKSLSYAARIDITILAPQLTGTLKAI